ncbi:MAG: hypothetical protein ACRBBR_11080 [Cellvibrionaceae bacterium]
MPDFSENPTLLFLLIFINIPIYYFLGKSFYKTWADFTEGLRYLFQPGWLSAIRGEFTGDFWETLRLYLYILCCGVIVVFQYKLFL